MNAVIAGLLRDLASVQKSTQSKWGYKRAASAVRNLEEPIESDKQAVLFYVYCADVAAFRDQLRQAGVDAGPIKTPFYAPRGEFRVVDPDGYVLMITHT